MEFLYHEGVNRGFGESVEQLSSMTGKDFSAFVGKDIGSTPFSFMLRRLKYQVKDQLPLTATGKLFYHESLPFAKY